MIDLTKDQEQAKESLLKFLHEPHPERPYFVLTGAAGTGKTAMLNNTLTELHDWNYEDRTAAAIAHTAKNVLKDSLSDNVDCYTVAQWLGLIMNYDALGNIQFTKGGKLGPRLPNYDLAILDEASMINDALFDDITGIIGDRDIKLIVVGDIYQLPPVEQNHDSKFFEHVDATLTTPVRFSSLISSLTNIYRDAIKEINTGYAGNIHILNERTQRVDRYDATLDSGYYFRNNIYELIDEIASKIKNDPHNINKVRMLAFKNNTVKILNHSIREKMYGKDVPQFVEGEIVISNGGYSTKRTGSIILNGEISQIKSVEEMKGPYGMPCLGVELTKLTAFEGMKIPVLKSDPESLAKFNKKKEKLIADAKRDPSQWGSYYKFIQSFAWFDYAYAVNAYKAQGQTIENVYVMEGEMMGIKPLTLKQKFQSLYVATTRAQKNLVIYNKNY
jgi:ATP-dependent exoDNAse (exonuclease V) alpha subunit